MDNMLSLEKLMKAVDPSIKKIEDVKSSMNPYILQNTMQGAMSDKMTLFEHQVMKPLDKAMLDRVFAENRLVVTVEEHSAIGGLGSAVAEYKAGFAQAPRQLMCNLGDRFQKVGSYEFQLQENGLTAPAIARLIEENLA